jgi:spore coat polysaccharide biosynthesis protein SpsF
MEKFGIIIEARCASTRLPNKILLKLEKKTILEFLIDRIKNFSIKKNFSIIIATTKGQEDKTLINIAKKKKIGFYQGSKDNVLCRVIEAAKKYDITNIVRITSDCPLIDLNIVDQVVQIFKNNNVDFVSNAHIRSYPDGMDVEVVTLRALEKNYKLSKNNPELLEHITLGIKKNKKKFKIINLIASENYFFPNLGLTLDEWKDYKLIKKIVAHFKYKKNEMDCKNIIAFLNKNKNLKKINSKVIRTTYNV